jgi:hypothetical protein
MSALVVSSVGVKDKDGAAIVAGTATDGTRQLPMVAVMGADGASFQPAMDATGRPGYFVPVIGGAAADGNSGVKSAATLRVVLATDQPTMTNPQPVTPAATESHLGEVGGRKVQVAATFARPADTTAYTAGDVVSNNTSTTTPMTFSNFARVSGGTGYIVGAKLVTDKKSITPRFRVHLFNATGATLAADNAANKALYADASKRIANFDLPAMVTPADTSGSDESRAIDLTLRIPFVAVASRDIYAVLEALDAFTPASAQNFRLELLGDLD